MKNFPFLLIALFLAGCTRPSTPLTPQGHDFAARAIWMTEVLLADGAEAPAGIKQSDFATQKAFFKSKMAGYQARFSGPLEKVLGPLRPKDLPRAVVYPFGGSDLGAALAAFPNLTEVTTISLESAGDPRALPLTKGAQITGAMLIAKQFLGTFFDRHDNSHANVWGMENSILPAQLTFSLGEALVFGLRPVSLRYFRIETNGGLHYYDLKEIAALEHTKGVKIHGGWFNPKCQHGFLHMEVVYTNAQGGRVIHRHISANLANSHYPNSPLAAHLKAKGKVAMMTKGASYLPWKPDFSAIADAMCDQAAFMIADCTGVLPWHAEKFGLKVTAYGRFNGAFLEPNDKTGPAHQVKLRTWWAAQPFLDTPVRFGYSDTKGAPHFLLYRR